MIDKPPLELRLEAPEVETLDLAKAIFEQNGPLTEELREKAMARIAEHPESARQIINLGIDQGHLKVKPAARASGRPQIIEDTAGKTYRLFAKVPKSFYLARGRQIQADMKILKGITGVDVAFTLPPHMTDPQITEALDHLIARHKQKPCGLQFYTEAGSDGDAIAMAYCFVEGALVEVSATASNQDLAQHYAAYNLLTRLKELEDAKKAQVARRNSPLHLHTHLMRTVQTAPTYTLERRLNEAGEEESCCIVTFLDGAGKECAILATESSHKKAKALAAYRALVFLQSPVAAELDFEQENPEDVQLL